VLLITTETPTENGQSGCIAGNRLPLEADREVVGLSASLYLDAAQSCTLTCRWLRDRRWWLCDLDGDGNGEMVEVGESLANGMLGSAL